MLFIHPITNAKTMFLWTLGALVFCFSAGLLLYGSYCAYTHFEFGLLDYDYVNYTNALWNAAHGNGLVCMGQSYLGRHLSFTLYALAPIMYLSHHGFLLSFVQWTFILSGLLFLLRAGIRQKTAPLLLYAVLLFGISYHFTQRLQLDEFHGVSLYLILVPWLYYSCRHAPRWSWVPLLMLLGVREDAGLIFFPVLFYMAYKQKWKLGYVYGAISLLYSLAAIFAIYPLLTGKSILETRTDELAMNAFSVDALAGRLKPLLQTALPLLPFMRKKGWIPVVAFVSAPLLASMLSSDAGQYKLLVHYAAPVFAGMLIAVIESARQQATEGAQPLYIRVITPLYLLLITAFSWYYWGFLPGCYRSNLEKYQTINLSGQSASRIAYIQLPRSVPVATSRKLSGFCAARERIYYIHAKKTNADADWIFLSNKNIPDSIRKELQEGLWGVHHLTDLFCILKRGSPTNGNNNVLYLAPPTYIPISETQSHGGRSVLDKKNKPHRIARYWEGDGSRAPINLCYGTFIQLDAGRYEALLNYRVKQPEKVVRGSWGWFSIHHPNEAKPISETEIEKELSGRNIANVTFQLSEDSVVEPRITGGDAELWLYSINIRQMDN